MFQEAPGFEQRLSDLQAQIDRLTIALQLWRDGQERQSHPDERLARFADDVADVLQEWSVVGERHARAVDALEHQVASFATIEARLHEESAQRFLGLERLVQQEWAALRHVQFEPGGPVREQAAALTHACVVAASARVAPVAAGAPDGAEVDLQQYFSRVVSEAPAPEAAPPAAPVAVHTEPVPVPVDAPMDVPAPVPVPAPAEPEAAFAAEPSPPEPHMRSVGPISSEYLPNAESDILRAEMGRRLAEMRMMFRESIEQATDQNDVTHRSTWRVLVAVACLFVIVAAGGAWWLIGIQRQLAMSVSRLADLEASSARAQAATERALADARAESARLAEAARLADANTAAMSAVIAAPDLVRYALTGLDGSAISAQLLWSRSRGLVLSATDLPPLAAGQAYQAWLLTESDAVSAGLLGLAADGRGSLLSARPPAVPRPVVGVSITLEPDAGSASPSGRIVALNRIARATP